MRYFAFVCVFPVILVQSNSALAGCKLSSFDTTAPNAIQGDVSKAGMQFRWASDFDIINGLSHVWHYVKNSEHSQALNFRWEKAGLRQEFVRPLPPGETICSQYPVIGLKATDVDDDAPIVFGGNNYVQRAAVYKKEQEKAEESQKFISKITSAYYDDEGVKRNLEVTYFYEIEGDVILNMEIIAPEGFYVGIANAGEFWSERTVSELERAAESQTRDFNFVPLPSFADSSEGARAFFAGWADYEQPGAIVQGSVFKIGKSVTDGTVGLTEMVIFDSERRPVASSRIAIPVTKVDQ